MTATNKTRQLSLEDMIRRRHDGPAWICIDEVGNGTGSNVRRHADLVAIGIWPSRGYEVFGYEIKASRGDVQRELNDPSKADAVGKYCDFWYLVVEDLAIIDGLVIPEAWGILAPRNQVLRVHRKAPKREATPITRAFSAAMIRRVVAGWVPRHEHLALKERAKAEAVAEIARDRAYEHDDSVRELQRLRAVVDKFAAESGVSLDDMNAWQAGDVGKAVKTLVRAREIAGVASTTHWRVEAESLLRGELNQLEHAVDRHERGAGALRAASAKLREMTDHLRAEMVPPTVDE